jgi:polyisoprenoid-binding protein YceI
VSASTIHKEFAMRFLLGFAAIFGLILCGCTPAPVAQSGGSGSVTTEGGEAAAVTNDPAEMPAGGESSATEPAAGEVTEPAPAATDPAPATGEAPATTEPAAGAPAETAALKPVALADGAAALSAANTKIQFTGTHLAPKPPDPRVGGFAKFKGEAKVDPATKALQSVSVEIDTASLFTPIEKLTTHLNGPDFFDVREYPTAKFESTEIVAGDGGQAFIKGNLTLHGQTKEISFPAVVSITDSGLTLKADFSISRSEFGMTFGEGQVEDKVLLSVAIGEKTAAP